MREDDFLKIFWKVKVAVVHRLVIIGVWILAKAVDSLLIVSEKVYSFEFVGIK